MAVNFSTIVYSPNYDMWARPITVTPASGTGAYQARGIYNRNRLNVVLEDGSIFTEQETILDILMVEFPVLPKQGDQIDVPADGDIPGEGSFTVTSTWDNGGGELNMHLRELTP
jgi:hypothetical protein